YRLTSTYVTDPDRSTLLIRTRFQSLDGGSYRLYVLENPSLAGGGAGDTAGWDGAFGALVASDGPVAAALKASVAFAAHSSGYSGTASDGYQDVAAHRTLANRYDTAGAPGNVVRMAQWLWNRQQITTWTEGAGVWYGPGSFPRYSPVGGIAGATAQQLGCCEQLDQDAFPIVLAWMVGLTDAGTWSKVKLTADHIVSLGPDTPGERWEEQPGKSPSTIAAEIAGLVCAGDIARRNGDTTSAGRYGSTADSWRNSLDGWTFTTTGFFGDHRYYERIDHDTNPDDTFTRTLDDGTWWERDIVDGGFLDLVRLGIRPASYGPVVDSLGELDAVDRVSTPAGDMWHRYNHDSYGESRADGTGWPAGHGGRTGRLWPLLSGERGEYELAAGHPAGPFLQTMANAGNAGFLIPEQVWDRPDQF